MRRETLIQLPYRKQPWRMLVCCILLNRTTNRQVRPILPELFRRWPNAEAMAAAGEDLEELLRPLGLWRQRSATLRKFSARWARERHLTPHSAETIGRLPGCGPYAVEAWRLVCLGDIDGFHPRGPEDKELFRYWYWAWRNRSESQRRHIEELAYAAMDGEKSPFRDTMEAACR